MGRCERVVKGDGSSVRVFHMSGKGGKARVKTCEGGTSKRCCENCAHVIRPGSHWLRIILSRWAGLLLCLNHEHCPGVISETRPGGACRNFRPRRRRGTRSEPPEPPNENVRYIPLTRNMFVMVDAEDFEELSRYKWHAQDGGCTFYAVRSVRGGTVLMHRAIMKAPKGMVVDHIDGNGLNNCKSNLRICTQAQNNSNSCAKGGCCGYKGVRYDKRYKKKKYEALIVHKGKKYWGGRFATALEAALARDRLARKIQGEHAYLNFPDGPPPEYNGPAAECGNEQHRRRKGRAEREAI